MSFVEVLTGLLSNTLETLTWLTRTYDAWIYGILFAVIFCETGLVITPFLPGDSLLFAAGMLAGAADLNPWAVWGAVFAAALVGDNVNYSIGRAFGGRIIESGRLSAVMKPEYLTRTEEFFVKHGGKTIALARFFPIIRTYTPFMAGVGKMHWPRFIAFSALGTSAWVSICIGAGWLLGGFAPVREHFEVIVILIILVTLAPTIIHAIRSRAAK